MHCQTLAPPHGRGLTLGPTSPALLHEAVLSADSHISGHLITWVLIHFLLLIWNAFPSKLLDWINSPLCQDSVLSLLGEALWNHTNLQCFLLPLEQAIHIGKSSSHMHLIHRNLLSQITCQGKLGQCLLSLPGWKDWPLVHESIPCNSHSTHSTARAQ